MECNNKYCVFNCFGSCCHESEDGFKNAIPNRLDCPSSVRSDIEINLYHAVSEIIYIVENMNHKQVSETLRYLKNKFI